MNESNYAPLDEIATILTQIKDTSSSKEKYNILVRHEDNEGLKAILKFIYNPYLKTCIAKAKVSKRPEEPSDEYIRMSGVGMLYTEVIEYFGTHNTGSASDVMYAHRFIHMSRQIYGKEASNLATAIVTQDLKIGVTATTLNKAYGFDFIPRIGCMLGTDCNKLNQKNIQWPCVVTEKLDGIRRLLIKENGVVSMYSRSGHLDEGLYEIINEAAHLPDNTVYDGELLAKGCFKDCIALRQSTNSIANSKGMREGVSFNIFDMIPLSEYNEGKSKNTAFVRKLLLGSLFDHDSTAIIDSRYDKAFREQFSVKDYIFDSIKIVPIIAVRNNMEEAVEDAVKIWADGGEGVMLNTSKGLYEVKRTKELIKIKHVEEHTLTVVGLVEGSGRNKGRLGALTVKYAGYPLGVGSGFSDAQRKLIWENPENYIGSMVEIDTFGESTNSTGGLSLNCPIFKRFVGEE